MKRTMKRYKAVIFLLAGFFIISGADKAYATLWRGDNFIYYNGTYYYDDGRIQKLEGAWVPASGPPDNAALIETPAGFPAGTRIYITDDKQTQQAQSTEIGSGGQFVALQLGNSLVTTNAGVYPLSDRGKGPVLYNGRMMLPVEEAENAFSSFIDDDVIIDYIAEDKQINITISALNWETFSLEYHTLARLWLDSNQVDFMDFTREVDISAVIVDGEVLVPLNIVAQAIGLGSTWIAESKTIVFYILEPTVPIQ